ncbi:MAG: hypothetical protein IH830_09200 [Planctomycetes bacterium]|nr:hypothetical protein [Planctomycetota bacterium]
MTNDLGCLEQFSRRRAAPRRGNTIVLVVGILVLLVIIATAYISRTHAGRVTSLATQRATLRDDNAQVIADSIASEIAEALFVRPIDPTDPALAAGVADPNYPHLAIRPDALRYGVDPNDADGNLQSDYPYNFAPFQVVPFTNWPDEPPGTLNPQWPQGPGSPDGPTHLPPPFDTIPIGAGNPLGEPGTSGNRLLADIEPLRWDTAGDGILDAFSHWPHMSNIARPGNGWRIVRDISDITDANNDGIGGILTDLSIPVEQWLPVRPLGLDTVTGDSDISFGFADSDGNGQSDFIDRWQNWLALDPAPVPTFGYSLAYRTTGLIPPNFYNLKDLNADGVPLELGERPQDEFVGPSPLGPPLGSWRWNVGRVLADTDGDGFTDSFWFHAPTMIERGIRQIVAIRIIDNSAMLNANVATRFLRSGTETKTTGATPADLALVGRAAPGPGTDNWNVGFYDNPDHDNIDGVAGPYAFDYLTNRWERHVTEVGLFDPSGDPIVAPDAFTRLEYWRSAGRAPFSATAGLTPFTLADELELRMFHGQNYPWIFSRYEYSVQSENGGADDGFLRGSTAREESSEYLDQLTNRMLAADSRRKLTLFNGARNDLMPPWLRWRWDIPSEIDALAIANPADNDGNGVADVIDRFLAQARTKLDLRELELVGGTVPPDGVLLFHQRLAPTLLLALTDGDETGALTGGDGGSYLGSYSGTNPSQVQELRKLAAAFTANILAYRDADSNAPLVDDPSTPELEIGAIPLPEWGMEPEDPNTRFLGLERQPFLLEAFIGHVYASKAIPEILPPPVDPPQYDGFPGNYVDQGHDQTTVVVVQIANPFDQAIDLSQYKLRVFGQELVLSTIPGLPQLQPGTESNPVTAIFYAIDEGLGAITGFRTKWLNFLDIEGGDHPPNTVIGNVNATGTIWSTDRDQYGPSFGPATGPAIELVRVDNSLVGGPHDVVIDRFDYDEDHPNHDEFRNAVLGLPQPPLPDEIAVVNPPLLAGIRIGDDDFWVTWARVTRAWGTDFNYDAGNTNTHGIQPNERAPRFVFARQGVTTGDDTDFKGDQNATPADDGPDPDCGYCGDSYADADPPDLPWFDKEYADATAPPARTRKPTFFTMNPVFDLAGNDIYPDFGGPNFEYGFYFYDTLYGRNGNNQPPPGFGIPDKGFYHFRDSLQMLQKDDDFEQVGELLNVWLVGHELQFSFAGDYDETLKTFSEYMSDPPAAGTGVNRLGGGDVIGNSQLPTTDPQYLFDPLHAVPALPAGLRVLDAFVCDGIGVNSPSAGEFLNANGFSGKMTPGLININTATPEVLRALPHMTRMVHEDNPPSENPYVRVPEAIVQYRERFNGLPLTDPNYLLYSTGIPSGADYSDRAGGLRPERGLASIGELMLLSKEANFTIATPLEPNANWRVDFAGLGPFTDPAIGVVSTQISTDVNDVFDPMAIGDVPDQVAQDAEEQNLLFAGISNLITTRSDMFTVYFKVRSFRQNRVTGIWDATDPEYIVDDSRYVMLVDRSEVNRPTDKPKILYLEKLPK